MNMPKTDSATFVVLTCLYEHGELNLDEIISHVGNLSYKSTRSGMQNKIRDMLIRGYILDFDGRYRLDSEIRDFVADVIEFKESIPKKDLVPPAYRNIFTPEMKNYNLFKNKRGYPQ